MSPLDSRSAPCANQRVYLLVVTVALNQIDDTKTTPMLNQLVKTDKSQFDEVLRRMLKKPPLKTSDIKAEKQKEPRPSRQK
ncbi:MAG: hypothetical protein WA824_05415 [Candidatus Sulfotelmatobacter sp.]